MKKTFGLIFCVAALLCVAAIFCGTVTACYLPLLPDKPDTASFREAASPFTAEESRIAGLASGAGVVVAAAATLDGKGEIAWSGNNGQSWTKVSKTFDIEFSSLTYGEGYFFAGGESGKAAYSSDGKTWHVGVIGPMSPWDIYGVAAGKIEGRSVFVAVGDRGRICYSVGGPTGAWSMASWTPFGTEETWGLTETVRAVAFGTIKKEGVFVAVGDRGKIAFAKDLSGRWSGGEAGSSGRDFYGVSFGNDKFIAVGGAGTVKFCADPASYEWTDGDGSRFHAFGLLGVAFDAKERQFVVFGENAVVGYSRFGADWSVSIFPQEDVGTARFPSGITALTCNESRVIFGGADGVIAYNN